MNQTNIQINYTLDYYRRDSRKLQQEPVAGEEAARLRAREIADDPSTLAANVTAYFADGEERQGEVAFVVDGGKEG